MKKKDLNIIDYLDIEISQAIEYDNKHNCFKWFTLGFSIAILIFTVTINIFIFAMS